MPNKSIPIVVQHPLAARAISRLRSNSTVPAEFRAMTRQLSMVLLLEATRDLPTREVQITTPLETTTGAALDQEIVAVAVLRAGLGMLDAAIDLLPNVSVGFAGMQRNEETAQPAEYYMKLPPLEKRRILVLEPMLATGGTLNRTLSTIKEQGGSGIRVLSVVAAPEGISLLQEKHPDVQVYCAALDRELNDARYICPGLGDMGDRLFGTFKPSVDEEA